MATYKELLAQRAALENQIKAARQAEIASAIALIRETVAEFDLTHEDVFPSNRTSQSKSKGKSVAPKYRDPATGQTWTGRGKAPKWIEGKEREQFLIVAQ